MSTGINVTFSVAVYIVNGESVASLVVYYLFSDATEETPMNVIFYVVIFVAILFNAMQMLPFDSGFFSDLKGVAIFATHYHF